jgi:single-stranded DNA-binding protein
MVAKARMVVKTPGDGDDMWVSVTAWENIANNLNYSFPEGQKTIRVIVNGRLQEDKWQGQDGNEKKAMNVVADNIAVALDYQVVSGIQYAGDDSEKSQSTYANKTEMAQDILNAEPVARTDYGEDEAPF